MFQHDFDDIEDYLHHRPPYLMVDKIISISESRVVTSKTIRSDEFFVSGHFPGASIFPGALMQELATQSAGILIAAKYNPMQQFDTHDPFHNEYALGVLAKVNMAKYKSFARPGDTLVATVNLNERVDNLFDFDASLAVEERKVMQISFQLMNIKSELLQGNHSKKQTPAT